jgi:flagellar motor switch protein FliN/FliY
MSSNPLPDLSAADQDFARHWGESTGRVLEQLHGSAFTARPLSPAVAGAEGGIWLLFKVIGYPSGELAFHVNGGDAVRFAQLLMSEPLDTSAALDEGHADGLREIFRQFAGLAAAACKNSYGHDAQFSLESDAAPAWEPAARSVWVFAAPKVDPLHWTLSFNADLHAALAAPPSAPAVAGQSAAKSRPADTAAQADEQADESAPANLDLLLDVALEASLRFGQREMLLREILELHPGSVVELDRRVQEPAELIVSGRVIAHGEVVIVDGNYGLRITDIAQASQRLKSVET